MAGKQIEQPEKMTIIPTLAPEVQAQLGLQNIMNAIAGLQQYAGTVLPADALGRLRDAAAYLKQTSEKAENYNAAWFGEQALRALNQKRTDIAMFAVTIGLGGGMANLSEPDKKQIAGIITQSIRPADTMLSRLIIKLEIASTQALVETVKKDFGSGVAQRLAGAATECQRRLGINDDEGAAKLVFMARCYMGLVMSTKNQKWAGRAEMEQAIDLEIGRKNGVAIFNKGAESYQLELQRQAMRIQLQQLGESIEQMRKQVAELDKYSQFMAKQRLAPMEAKLGVLEEWLGNMTGIADFSATTVIRGKEMQSFMDELAGLLSEADREAVIYRTSSAIAKQAQMNAEDIRMAGSDSKVLAWLTKADKGLENAQRELQKGDFTTARKEFLAAMESKAMALALYSTPKRVQRPRDEEAEMFQLPKLAGYMKMAGELFDLLAGRPVDPEAAMERANTLEKAIWLVNTTVMCIPPRVTYTKEQDVVLELIGQGKLDRAYDAMREMDLAAKGYIRITYAIMMAVGVGTAFIPKFGPFISTAIFASMATDNILTEYRENGHVSVQAWAWAGISVLPLVGWAGKLDVLARTATGTALRLGTGGAITGTALYGGYGTYRLYDAWARETDPYRRHELLSDALYNTLFLAPAALYLGARAPTGYRYMKGAAQEMYYTFQDMMRIPTTTEIRQILQPVRTVGYGATGTTMQQTGTGAFTQQGPQPTYTPPKQSFFRTTRQRILNKMDEWRGSRKGKLQPPNMDEFMTAAGKDLGATMATKPQQMAYAMKALHKSITEKLDAAACRMAMKTIYADHTLRRSLIGLARQDVELAQALGYIDDLVQASYKKSSNERDAVLLTISQDTRNYGIPTDQMKTIMVACERYGVAKGTPPLKGTEDLLGNRLTIAERAGMLGILRTEIMEVAGKKSVITGKIKKKKVPIVDDVTLQNEYNRVIATKTRNDVMAIKTNDDPVMGQIRENLASTAATEADIDAALLAAMKQDNVIKLIDRTYGQGTGAVYSKALEGGQTSTEILNRVLGEGKGTGMEEGQFKKMLIEVRNNPELAEDIQAVHIIKPGVEGIKQTFDTKTEEHGAANEKKSVPWRIARMGGGALKWGFWDVQHFGPKKVIESAGTKRFLGVKKATYTEEIALAKMTLQLGVWWLDYRLIGVPIYHGAYNLIYHAKTAEQGMADAKRLYGADISKENAIFIRSEAGVQFCAAGVPVKFPKGKERRPGIPQTFDEMLGTPGIVLEPTKLNDILDDGRQMEGELGTINRLLRTGKYDENGRLILVKEKYDELNKLLTGMKIDATVAIKIYESKKSLDMGDMADLRRNDWLAKGYIYGYKEVLANTICSDAGVGEEVRTLDLGTINSLLMDRSDAARQQLQTMLDGTNLTLANIAGLLRERGRRALVADDLPQLAEIARANAVGFLCSNTGEFRGLWENVRNGNLPVVWFGKAIAHLSSGGQLADAGLYLSVPITFDSFLSRLDERATMDPKFRPVFLGLLDKYKNNSTALARFNGFVLGEGEEIYGDVSAIAESIAAAGTEKDELAKAQSDGRVAERRLMEIEPRILDNVQLLKLIRNKSRLENGSLTEDEGIYAWIVENQNRISENGGLVAILNDLNGRQVIKDSKPFDIYNPADRKGQLVVLEEYFEGKGWMKPRKPETEAWYKTAAKGALAAGKWAFVPKRKVMEPSKEEKAEATAKEEELKRKYPPEAMLRPERYATETDATAAPIVGADVKTALGELVKPEYLERAAVILANAAKYQAVLESHGEDAAKEKYKKDSNENRHYRLLKISKVSIELDDEGVIKSVKLPPDKKKAARNIMLELEPG
jgi:hypothetical protein